jgi:CBS domain-containing protein
MGKTARDIMHKHTFVPEDMTVKELAGVMNRKKIGSVLIKTKKGLGVLTERDIVGKIIVEDRDPAKTKVGDIMHQPVVTVEPDADLYKISRIFNENNFRRLPVVEKGEVIGILTTRDVAKQFIPPFFKETYHFKDFRF